MGGEGARLRLTTSVELDMSKVAGLDKQAKELSGKAVVNEREPAK